MATRADIESTYNYMDRLWRASLGDHADITCAYFDGNYSKTLEQAQRDKYDRILALTEFRPGDRVLDVGCGWGGFLCEVRQRGGIGKGLTLSTRQAHVCRAAALDVDMCDWNDYRSPEGAYDVIASVGAFEHFCSKTDYVAGNQMAIYRRFFARCHHMLAKGRSLFLQSMTWGKKVPDPRTISVRAPRGSDDYLLGVVERFYPGSWLADSAEQIIRAAEEWFSVDWVSNGRLDYIETMTRWGEQTHTLRPGKIVPTLALLCRAAMDEDYRYRIELLRHGYNRECFVREVMDHYRMVLHRR